MACVGEYVLAKRPILGGLMRIECNGINGDDGCVMWRSSCKQYDGKMSVAAWDGIRNEQRDLLVDVTMTAEINKLRDGLRRCGYLTATVGRLRKIITAFEMTAPGMAGQVLPQACRDLQEIKAVCEELTGETFEELPP